MTILDRLGSYRVVNLSADLDIIDLRQRAHWSRRTAGQDPAQRPAIVVCTVSDEIGAVFDVHGLLWSRGQGGVTSSAAGGHGLCYPPLPLPGGKEILSLD